MSINCMSYLIVAKKKPYKVETLQGFLIYSGL